MTTFPDPLYHMGGVPVGGMFTQGNSWFVKPVTGGGDGQRGNTPLKAFKTLTHAQLAAVANRNDVVYLFSQGNTGSATTDYQTTSLLWAKDHVHLLGVNGGPIYSQRSRIASPSTGTSATVGTAINPLVTLSANGCRVEGIEMFQGYNHANALGCLLVSGDRNVIRNCHIAGMGIAASAAVAGGYSLKVTGSENLFEDCTIGLDTIARTTSNAEIVFAVNATTGSSPTRNHFRRCRIVSYTTTAATHVWVNAPVNTFDRTTIFEDCTFVNYPTGTIGGALTMNQGFTIVGGGSPSGIFLLKNCLMVGATTDETTASNYLFKGQSNSTFDSMISVVTHLT